MSQGLSNGIYRLSKSVDILEEALRSVYIYHIFKIRAHNEFVTKVHIFLACLLGYLIFHEGQSFEVEPQQDTVNPIFPQESSKLIFTA